MPSGRGALLSILLLALFVRSLAAVWWEKRLGEGHRFGMADSESYWTLASAIAEGKPYEYGGPDARVFRTPGYPLLLAPIIAAFGDTSTARWLARCLGVVLGTVCVGLAMIWASLLFNDRRAAVWAGLITALYPGLIALSVIILSEALFCPLMVAHLVCWTRAEQVANWRSWIWSVLGGVCAGTATLARPSWLLFIPFAGAVGLVWAKRHRHRAIVLAIMVLAFAATMTPWWIRNHRAVGQFVPTTLQVGASLYDGLNAKATGASNMWFADVYYRAANADRHAGRLPPGSRVEAVVDQRLRRDATQWALEHPQRAAHLGVIKFVRMWNIWPNDDQFRGIGIRTIIAAGYLPVIILALMGAWWFVRRDFVFALCGLPAVYLTLLHMIFVSSLRYREPAMIGGIVLAAGILCGKHRKLAAP